MKMLALFLLFAWPWSPDHSGTFTAKSDGRIVHTFKHPFPKTPACTSNARGMEYRADFIAFSVKKGDVVSWTCK